MDARAPLRCMKAKDKAHLAPFLDLYVMISPSARSGKTAFNLKPLFFKLHNEADNICNGFIMLRWDFVTNFNRIE